MTILRKLTVFVVALSLCLTTVACGGSEQTTPNSSARNVSQTSAITKLSDGQYQVQQATYDDANGEYTLFLLNNTPPTFTTEKLQMARLTDAEIKEGKKTYLKVENGQPVLYLTEDFKIEYVHNVTQTQTNPQTGQQETVIVRRETGFWAPFAGALAGQAIGSLLFRPQYYVPPVYQPGGGLIRGYGGYGSSYDEAVNRYRNTYNEPPAAVRNRNTFRTTGAIRRSSPGSSTVRTTPRTTSGSRSTGTGYGAGNLDRSRSSNTPKRDSGSRFGSGRSPSRSTGFGARRRR